MIELLKTVCFFSLNFQFPKLSKLAGLWHSVFETRIFSNSWLPENNHWIYLKREKL